jgi:hypothetical protein
MARKSHIYVLPEYVGPRTDTRAPEANAAYQILDRHYHELPTAAKKEFDVLLNAELREGLDIRNWAREFRTAFDDGRPLPQRAFGKTVAVNTSTLKGAEDLSSMGRAYLAVLLAGSHGVTSIEARKLGEKGGGISGALTKLHQAKVIACLEATR